MRVSPQERDRTREKILSETLASLKVSGRNGAPVDKIMKRLGLTSGALYSHFKSKEDLFAQVVLREIDRLIERHKVQINEHGTNAMVRYIDYYLSEKHIDSVERGCLFVALGSDLHRLKPSQRELIEYKINLLFSVLIDGLPEGVRSQQLSTARFVFSTLVGALVLARSMKTKSGKLALLKSTRQQLLKTISKK